MLRVKNGLFIKKSVVLLYIWYPRDATFTSNEQVASWAILVCVMGVVFVCSEKVSESACIKFSNFECFNWNAWLEFECLNFIRMLESSYCHFKVKMATRGLAHISH